MKIGVCTPSRGLIHSRTAQAIVDSFAWNSSLQWRWFFSHDKPIPDCFNEVVDQAVKWRADLIWIVEEDIAFSPLLLGKLLDAIADGADIAVSDYLMERLLLGDGIDWGVCYDGAGNVTWCRTGCILFKRECLDELPRPWFTLRNRLVKPGVVTWDEGQERGYGADIPFTFALYQLGFKFKVIEETCDHLRVVEWGNERGNNSGYHRIEPLGKARQERAQLEDNEWQESMEPMRPSRLVLPQIAR